MKKYYSSAGVALSVVAAFCAACDGHIEGPDGSGAAVVPGITPPNGVGGLASSPGATPQSCEGKVTSAPLPARLRRLTPLEYQNSVRSLVGDSLVLPALDFPPDGALGAFHNAATLLRVTDLLATGLADAAEQLAQAVTEQLPPLLGCDPTVADEEGCVRSFLERFAARAYRRPLEATELERLVSVYRQGRAGAEPRDGVALVLEVVFQSPKLLYRTELGAKGAADAEVLLTPHEISGQLSYLVTLSPPDAELERAAAAGELSQPDGREKQARRLLAQPSARAAMAEFASEWLDLGELPALAKDPTMFPHFSPSLARSMQRETQALFSSVVFEGDGKLRSLLLADYTFVDGPLASLYGLAPPVDAAALSRVALDPGRRLGLLTQPSLLTAHSGSQWSSPTHRGKLIRNQFLCEEVPPAPPGLIVTVPPATPGVTTRQRISTHASDPSCASCHAFMDPLGFGLEHYDAVGAYRADEGGLVIDSSGSIGGGTDADGSFDDAMTLARRLADSADVRGCFAKQWTTFAIGGEVDHAVACSLLGLFTEFSAEQLSLPDLLIGLVRSDAFIARHAGTP